MEKKQLDQSVFNVKKLTVAYNLTPVLWDINLTIPKGKLVAIIGPNGAGKSTLMKASLNIIKPLTGFVTFFGKTYTEYRDKISYIPQKGDVNWNFPTTVFDVVLMGSYAKLSWIKRPKKEDKEKAMYAIEQLGLQDFSNRQISELSGGQQQRVFLARSLMKNSDLYFLDEPFAGIDNKTEKIIIDILKTFKKEGKTSIVVHHDLQTVREYFDYVVLLNKKLIVSGDLESTFTTKNIETTYNNTSNIQMLRG